MKTTTIASPPLAPPGAGLPWPELQAARLIFGWLSWRASRASAAALLAAEQRAILALAESCDPASAVRPVLIARLRGMEDSSRFWSVCMTLDHLRIVNLVVAETIETLARGVVPPRVASTAAVKPSAQAGAEMLGKFARSCELIAGTVAALPDLRTPIRYAHPWFGPLDAAHWHFMAGFHLRLHRAQIGAILRGLAKGEL